MKFASTKEHRDYFEKQQFIEFEELLSPTQLTDALAAIETTLSARFDLRTNINMGNASFSSDQLFMKGRDLWRDHPVLLRLARHVRFVEMAAELFQQKSLRLAYDQYFAIIKENPLKDEISLSSTPSPYHNFLHQSSSLKNVSCIQGLVGGLILCLSGSSDNQPTEVFPKKPGHGTFFSADYPIAFDRLNKCEGQSFFLIVYAKKNAVYIYENRDPHLHQWKKIGYSFGDKLLDKWNPILYRYR